MNGTGSTKDRDVGFIMETRMASHRSIVSVVVKKWRQQMPPIEPLLLPWRPQLAIAELVDQLLSARPLSCL